MAMIFRLAAALLALLALASPARADDPEAVLRERVQQAVWPADIVALSSQYLARYPRTAWADSCNGLRERATVAMRALDSKDVQLHRAAFVAAATDLPQAAADLRQASLADAAAALRLAQLYQSGDKGVAPDLNRYVGWLQYATRLGSKEASYELAVHYRRQDQPVLASVYEARAVEMGFEPPRWLDHVRK